jgi:hypothetical protein
MDQAVRGYFALGDNEASVDVTSDADFLVYLWARNIETFHGGVQVLTPPSFFRTPASTGPHDGLVLDVPAQTGMDLGCIGAGAGETLNISNSFGARVTIFVTVLTATGAAARITTTPVG